ncbi:MAG: molybdate ABC transporter permease subunit [Flammeovirgaceae bacterium]|nr:molybdate ABC transporter permease subunit [Flammeovirgaceae bacterium]
MDFSLSPFFLSLKLAAITTFFLLFLGLLLSYLIHFKSGFLQPFFKALVSLPLVLPPSVLGYYLLVGLNPNGLIGRISDQLFGLRLVFSFPGLVIGSIIFSLPFMVNPIVSAIENLPKNFEEAAYTLGKSRWTTFFKVLLPNIKPALIIGIVMAFAHTIGEFGVILMIGGNIPEETRVASIAIYNEVELLNYDNADLYAIILLSFSFVVLSFIYFYQQKWRTDTF